MSDIIYFIYYFSCELFSLNLSVLYLLVNFVHVFYLFFTVMLEFYILIFKILIYH